MVIIAEIYKSESERAFGTDPAARKKYLSKSLDELWTRAEAKVNPHGDEAGAIDWDVATNSQGMEVKSYRAKYAFRDDQRALVVVTLVPKGDWVRNSPDENVIRYHFIREGGRWTINDIGGATDGAPGALRDLLTQSLKD